MYIYLFSVFSKNKEEKKLKKNVFLSKRVLLFTMPKQRKRRNKQEIVSNDALESIERDSLEGEKEFDHEKEFIPLDETYQNDVFNKENCNYDEEERPELESGLAQYLKSSHETLLTSMFASEDDCNLFIGNVLSEIRGSEVEVALSYESSRFLQDLLSMAGPEQLKLVFEALSGSYIRLSTHSKGSRVIETLLKRGALAVHHETIGVSMMEQNEDDQLVSFSSLLLFITTELREGLTDLIFNKYATHVIRLILLVLSGKSRDPGFQIKSNKSKQQKQHWTFTSSLERNLPDSEENLSVPTDFRQELSKYISSIVDTVLAVCNGIVFDIYANPVLQLAIKFEKSIFNQYDIIYSLVGMDKTTMQLTEKDSSISFLRSLAEDNLGSHILDTIIENSPERVFKTVFKLSLLDQLQDYIQNPIAVHCIAHWVQRAASLNNYVASIKKIVDSILGASLEINSSNITALRVLLEASSAAGHYREKESAEFVLKALDLIQNNPEELLGKVLGRGGDNQSLKLAMVMLRQPSLQVRVAESLAAQRQFIILAWCKAPTVSHFVQECMRILSERGPSESPIRRKLLNALLGKYAELAQHTVGSHIVDQAWTTSETVPPLRERIAKELAENYSTLNESFHGRKVAQNWHIRMYVADPSAWLAKNKGNGTSSHSVNMQSETLTPLQRAMKRFAESNSAPRKRVAPAN